MNLPLTQAFKILGLFVGAYVLFFMLWMGVKNPYNRAITVGTFHLSSWKYDLHVTSHSMKGREMTFVLSNNTPVMGAKGIMPPFEIELKFDVESVTFNVPMTLSLITALIVLYGGAWREKLRLAGIGMAALLALHVITMLIIETSLVAGTTETSPLMRFYLSRFTLPLELLENLGMMLNSYAARFEPFLIAVLVWWKVNASTDSGQ